MSISKEIFGIETEQINHPEIMLSPQQEAINKTLDLIDQHELSEEELAKIIACVKLEFPDLLLQAKSIYAVAKAIKQNQHRIFVRKT